MQREIRRWLIRGWLPLAFLAIASLQVILLVSVSRHTSTVDVLLDELRGSRIMRVLESQWTDADGIEHKVTTQAEDGEDPGVFAARHAADVQALKAIYPPA